MSAVIKTVAMSRPFNGADPMLPQRTAFCRCSGCQLYFRSVRAFEAHRVVGADGDRVCLATPGMPDAGLELDSQGYWRRPKRKFRSTHLRAVPS